MNRVSARFSLGMGVLIVAWAAPRPCAASCGSASCFLVTKAEEGVETAGSFDVDLSFRYVDQSRKLRGRHSVSDVLVPKIDFENQTIELDHHREIRTSNTTLQLNLAYGITSRISLFGVVPLLVEKDHEHFDDAGTPQETFTSADGTRGFGDVAVGARYAFLVRANDLFMGSVAAKFPTGDYKLLDSEGAINEPTIQPGSGSYDGLVTLYYVHHPFPSPLEWFVSASGRINRRNPLDYTIGSETVATAGLSYAASPRWIFSVQASARHAGRDDYRGESVPSTGSDSVLVSPGIRLRTEGHLELYGYVQVPVYQKVNESQLAPRTGFAIGVSKSF